MHAEVQAKSSHMEFCEVVEIELEHPESAIFIRVANNKFVATFVVTYMRSWATLEALCKSRQGCYTKDLATTAKRLAHSSPSSWLCASQGR